MAWGGASASLLVLAGHHAKSPEVEGGRVSQMCPPDSDLRKPTETPILLCPVRGSLPFCLGRVQILTLGAHAQDRKRRHPRASPAVPQSPCRPCRPSAVNPRRPSRDSIRAVLPRGGLLSLDFPMCHSWPLAWTSRCLQLVCLPGSRPVPATGGALTTSRVSSLAFSTAILHSRGRTSLTRLLFTGKCPRASP